MNVLLGCRCKGFWPRTGHAFIRNFITYNRTEKQLRPQFALYAGARIRAISSLWFPGKPNAWVEGYQAMILAGRLGTGDKLGGRVAPEIALFLRRKSRKAMRINPSGSKEAGSLPPGHRVSMFPKGAGVIKCVVANEQLYASRYIRIALQVFSCVPDTQNPGKPGSYLVEMNDSRVLDYGGIKLSIVRKIATEN